MLIVSLNPQSFQAVDLKSPVTRRRDSVEERLRLEEEETLRKEEETLSQKEGGLAGPENLCFVTMLCL
jgi:hypothetical protein